LFIAAVSSFRADTRPGDPPR